MKNIFRLDADKSGSVSFRELVIKFTYFRLTSSSKDIVPKWVFKSCIELEKCQKEHKEKWQSANSKSSVTMPGNFWNPPFQKKLQNKFSMMPIKIEMDLSLTLNISNLFKNTFVKPKLNSKEQFNHQNPLRSQLI